MYRGRSPEGRFAGAGDDGEGAGPGPSASPQLPQKAWPAEFAAPHREQRGLLGAVIAFYRCGAFASRLRRGQARHEGPFVPFATAQAQKAEFPAYFESQSEGVLKTMDTVTEEIGGLETAWCRWSFEAPTGATVVSQGGAALAKVGRDGEESWKIRGQIFPGDPPTP